MSLFIVGLGRGSSKEGRTSIFIGEMDISRIMVYVQQVEKKKARDKYENRNKMSKSGNESGQRIGHNFIRISGMHHYILVHLQLETELSFIVRTFELGLHIHMVVWCKEVISLLHALSMVEITLAYVVNALRIVFNCGWTRHFMKKCPKSKQRGGNMVTRAESSLVAPPHMALSRGDTSSAGGETNWLYAFNNFQEQEDSPNVVTGMIDSLNLSFMHC